MILSSLICSYMSVFSMESVGVNVIEVAALGRPFQLGMLYDCRKDALVPGITLWNEEKLKQSIRSRPQINTDFKVTASDSIEEKSNLLNIEASMKLSLLCGLISVTGATKYLNDTKKSFIQQRLTLHYHSTTRFEELSMNHLASENIAHHEVIDHDTATHVVTAVLYGADACFLFDREVSSDEDKTTVEGEVKAAFEKLKVITVDVNANLNMNEVQKNAVQKFSVTFYGDFQLPSNPTSFEDALKVYAKLPKLLGENKDLVVPLRVWLYPLSKLNSRASKLLKEIKIDLVSDIESALESLNTTEMKCTDLLKDSSASALPPFQNKVLQMKQNCNKYKLSLMKKLGSLLPQIRGEKITDSALIDLLKDHHESPFRESELEEWLKVKEKESEIIKTLLRQLIDSGAKVEDNLEAILMDLDVKNLVSYTFTSLDWSDVLLPKQITYLRSSTMRNDTDSKKETSWLTPAIHKTMRSNLEMFKSLIDSKDRKPAKFIVSSKQMVDHPGSCILLYEGGCVEAVCFSPPSRPARPITAEVKGDSVVINVKPSTCPATEELKLLYKIKQEKIWTSQPVLKDQNTVTLTDLRPGTEYEIKCAAVGKLNYTTESDVIRVKTEGRNHPVGYCGLINPGWGSWFNALLQTLYMTKEYRDHVMRLNTGGGSTEDKFIKELKVLFERLGKGQGPVSTQSTQDTVHKTFAYGFFWTMLRQEDKYLKCLWKILMATHSSKIFMFDEDYCEKCKSRNSLSITGIISVTVEEFQDVEDALQIRKGIIKQFCHHCNKPLETKQKIHSQKIQILHLRRFKEKKIEKNELEVIIRPHLKVSSHEFELYAIINHYGLYDNGHFNVDIKCENQQWCRFDGTHMCESPRYVLYAIVLAE
ncbi:cytolytic toxin-alpha-like [Misgurnus anguillicaudatus]|uniref:cytolytic toxin-alpha-like n=1 Tax=Misgurnus anguillicaudatus TaxID=75329 RepID=UPI003CCF0859